MFIAAAAGGGGISPEWVIALISIVTVIAGIVAWLVRSLWHVAARTSRFMDDYFGEAAAPGRPERAGVMTRLENLERLTAGISQQVHLNNGSSLKDAVTRVESKVSDLSATVEQMRRQS